MLQILGAGDSWAEERRAPDGGFCGGPPFILGCKQPEQLYYKWVIYRLLREPSSVGSSVDFVTRGDQCAWCLWFVWTQQTRKKSCCLEHLHVGLHVSCKWVPARSLLGMSSWLLISFFRSFFLSFFLFFLLTIAVISHSEARMLGSPLPLFILLGNTSLVCTWTASSFCPQVSCVSEGLSLGCSLHLCL